jgi:hypothetical protein
MIGYYFTKNSLKNQNIAKMSIMNERSFINIDKISLPLFQEKKIAILAIFCLENKQNFFFIFPDI